MDGEDIIGLYDRHARQLLGFFMRRTRDPQLALDLLGETFLAVFENRPLSWAAGRGARGLAISHRRRQARWPLSRRAQRAPGDHA